MARREKPRIYSHAEMVALAQKAELEVIYERTKLEIQENQNRHHVRRDVLDRLRTTAAVTVQDLLERDPVHKGQVKLKDLTKVPEHVARLVKKLKVTTTSKPGGDQVQVVEVDLAHHLEYDALLGKYTGLLSDKHLHLHANAPQPPEPGQPAPEKLADLSPDRLKAERARLEKEVEALEVRDTPPEENEKS